jgi:hypothetical protein
MWQALETKAKFISQAMTGDNTSRKAEDVGGQELSYAEVKAIASGNRPSHEGAPALFDECIALCRGAGFRKRLLRGDTDFSQTQHLDRWLTLPAW